MLSITTICALTGIALAALSSPAAETVPEARADVVVAGELNGLITSVTVEHVRKVLAEAATQRAALALFEMDTPGGLVTSTEEIVQAILASEAPVAVHVRPAGAQAASAGLYIANSADIIVMSPGTRIGAGHPVSIFRTQEPTEKGQRDYLGEKVENDLAAAVRSIATQRGRNAAVYEKMVRESISLTEREAVDQKVIDLIAGDVDELLVALDGRQVKRFDGSTHTLSLQHPVIRRLEMTPRQRLLSWIASPQVSAILFAIAALGLFIEFNHPGLIAPGAIGGLALILWALSMQLLPINALGLVLIVLALALFGLEIKVTSHGLLTLGGAISLTLGLLTLFDAERLPDLTLPLTFVLPISLTVAATMAIVTTVALRAQRARVTTGIEGLRGETGEAVTDIDARGKVFVHGEYWDATSTQPIAKGRRVRIKAVRDMAVEVEPIDR